VCVLACVRVQCRWGGIVNQMKQKREENNDGDAFQNRNKIEEMIKSTKGKKGVIRERKGRYYEE